MEVEEEEGGGGGEGAVKKQNLHQRGEEKNARGLIVIAFHNIL